MKMNRLKIVGICIAIVVLVLSLAARFVFTEKAAVFVLPVIEAAVVAVCCIDTALCRNEKKTAGTVSMTSVFRCVMLWITAVILAAICVIVLAF